MDVWCAAVAANIAIVGLSLYGSGFTGVGPCVQLGCAPPFQCSDRRCFTLFGNDRVLSLSATLPFLHPFKITATSDAWLAAACRIPMIVFIILFSQVCDQSCGSFSVTSCHGLVSLT